MNASQLALIRQHSDRFFTEFFQHAQVTPTPQKLAETRRYVENWTDDEVQRFLQDLVEVYQLPADLPERLATDLAPPAAAPDLPTAIGEESVRPVAPPVPAPAAVSAVPIPPSTPVVPTKPRRRVVGAGAAGVAVAVLVAAGFWWLGRGPAGAPYVAITNAVVRARPEPSAAQTGTVARAQTLSATGKRAGRWVEIQLKGEGVLDWSGRRAWVDSQFVMRETDYKILNRVLPEGGTGLTSQHYWALRRYATPEGGTREAYRLEALPGEAARAGLRTYLTANFTGKAFQDPNLRRNRSKHRNLLVLFTPRDESTRKLVIFEFDNAAHRYGRVVYEEDVEPGLALKAEPGNEFSLRDFSGNTRWRYRHEGGEVRREAADLTELLEDSEDN